MKKSLPRFVAFIGVIYATGEGAEKDDEEAAKWFRLAAEQGRSLAQLNLGVMYFNGEGVPEHFVQAHFWFDLAAATGNESARENREVVAAELAPEQIAAAQRLTREWRESHQQ